MEERRRARADPAVPLSEALLCLSTPEGWRCLIVFFFWPGPYLFQDWDTCHSADPRPCPHCSSTAVCSAAPTPGASTASPNPPIGNKPLSPRGRQGYRLAGGGRRWQEVAGGGGRRRKEVGGEGGVCARVRHIGKKRKKKEKNKEIPFTRISTNTHT